VVRLLNPPTLTVPPRWGQYDWSSHVYKLPSNGQGVIFFAADTNRNLHVILSPEAEAMFPLYEIVIGWRHSSEETQSEVRTLLPRKSLLTYSPKELINPLGGDLHRFWISMDAETQLIYVGQGENPCDEDAFIIFKDPCFLSNVQYFAFSSNDVAITYSDIKVEAGRRPTSLRLRNSEQDEEPSSRLWNSVNTSQILSQSLNVAFSKSAENYGNYNWLKTYKLPTDGRGIVCFSVSSAVTDVHVAISPKPETVDPMYEVVIGGWGNSESAIRRKSQGDFLCRVRTVDVIKPKKVNHFWVSINVDTQLIHVGAGNEPNLASVICLWKDPNFLNEAQYVSFPWETTVIYSNIFVASPSATRLLRSHPLEMQPCFGKYNWSFGHKLLSEGRGILYFAALAKADVYVAISPLPENVDPMYEIVLGGWGNTRCEIRKRSQGQSLSSVNKGLGYKHTEGVHHFWVSIDKDTKLIQVGRGNHANLESVMCMYRDQSFIPGAMYIAFSSWNIPVTYSAISVSFQGTTVTSPFHRSPVLRESFHSGNALLQNPEFDIIMLEGNYAHYKWRYYFELPWMGQGVVYFAAETITDVHVAISPVPKTVDPMYEIVIGGWNNSKSVIRRKSQGPNLCCVDPGSDGPPIKPGLNHYWLSVDAVTRLIKVGWGTQQQVESTILLIYKDANFISNACYVTFSNWNAPVTYSQISLEELVK
jgi:hypothetical protein